MKKLLILSLVVLLMQNVSEAKNYAEQHIKELKKSQKYSTTSNYFEGMSAENSNVVKPLAIKDPKLIKLNNYKEISKADYNAKIAKDNIKYKEISKFLAARKVDNYNVQAYGEDFYKIYRVAERIIRANNLDFINWRLVIDVDSSFNAYMSEPNCIAVNTGAIDTLYNNEDALAFLIGHEIAHSMLGHKARTQEIVVKLNKIKRLYSDEVYWISFKKYAAEIRGMEFAADTEGAVFAARAGYDLDKGKEVLSYINTFGNAQDSRAFHPVPEKRLKSYAENKKYFMTDEWVKQGKYNIYNSEVLNCQKSSTRNSITLLRGEMQSPDAYYSLETPEQMYIRYGYGSYINGEFDDSIKYFEKYIKENKNNYVVYLYMSYAYENLYKQTNKEKFLKQAKEYAGLAHKLAPNSKTVQEQVSAL